LNISELMLSAIARRRIDQIGRGARFIGTPHVENLGRIEIGDDLVIHSRPVVSHLVTGPDGILQIGRSVTIEHGAAITSHLGIRIGDGTHVGPYAMIMDTDFHEAGDHAARPEPQPIEFGARVRLGARVTILRGALIGAGASVASGSVVSGVVPAGSHVAGVPARQVRSTNASSTSLRDGGNTQRDIALHTRELVRRVFGLKSEPEPQDGPHTIGSWDSLGTLNLLLSLEDSFGVRIDERDMLRVRHVADVEVLVAEKLSMPREH
jgi:acetyltransferase-like isoleucine patch superfamily enzyme/acyl carrier protein